MTERVALSYGLPAAVSGSFNTDDRCLAESGGMTYTPALGRLAPVRFYDRVVALTRERLWRALTVAYVAPRAGATIADVGCGTGTLACALARVEPQARIVGVDPDPAVLAVARRRSAAVRWETGTGDTLAGLLGPGSADVVVSSLVLHQCPLAMKQAILAAAHQVLRPGGRLVIADYGQQRTRAMRLAFRLVQIADGTADTRLNADGGLPRLITAAGFTGVRETEVVPTVTGSISIYVAGRD